MVVVVVAAIPFSFLSKPPSYEGVVCFSGLTMLFLFTPPAYL